MNPRENAFIAYRHETPDWVPARSLDFNVIFPAPYVERYQGTGVGKDWFGVTWQYEPLTKAPMPLPGQPMLADIEDWRGDVLFPDLDSIDWEKQAKQDMAETLMEEAVKKYENVYFIRTNASDPSKGYMGV